MEVPVDIEVYNTNEIKAGNGVLDFDVMLWKTNKKGFAWEIYLPKQTLSFHTEVYNPISDESVYLWENIEFDPLEYEVKIKSDIGVIGLGGFYPSRVEVYPKEKKLVIVF
jgi:hypothetical protein